MSPRALTLILACIAFHGMSFPATCTAEDAARTIRLDGKTLYIPEVKLTRETNPVSTFLYIGSWETKAEAGKNQDLPYTVDPKNHEVHIKFPGRLLENSRTRVVTQNNVDAFLDGISWGQRQATHIAFNIISARRQSAMIEINTDSGAALFHNGKFICNVSADSVRAAGGCGYLPVALEPGKNIINIKLSSARGKPRLQQLAVNLDRSHDLAVAWQARGGFLTKLLYMPAEHADTPALAWNPLFVDFFPSLEVRNVSTDKIVLQKESVRQGRLFDEENQNLAPGIYEAVYRTEDESASELFLVGNPEVLFAELQDTFSQYSPDSESKLDIEAQLRRARILLAKDNYNVFDRKWQEKAAYTFSCLATIGRRLKEGATNIAKDQPGLHIRGFASAEDGSDQFYRLYIPSTYSPDAPLPLIVIPSTRISNKERPFIEGPVIANHREAVRWAKYAEQHGFALLWPGYRGAPEGYSYESVHINEAIQAVGKDYNIDRHRISIYATCGAGYYAGRLLTEYPNRFAAIVYDEAVFDLSLDLIKFTPSLKEWYATVNPSRYVIGNRNLKIFVLHDDTAPPGHGPLELTTAFLEQAGKTRDDVVSYLSDRPMTTSEHMDMVFSWLAPCRNENPDDKRSHFLAKAGYTGPIMEIFTTPVLVVEGSRAQGDDLESIHSIVESFKNDYTTYFHGAECAVKKDTEVTQADIDNYSLILVGNPQSNSVWGKLQPQLPIKMTSSTVLYGNDKLTGDRSFRAIVRHPKSEDKFILMIGAANLKYLWRFTTRTLFTAWYDCLTTDPRTITSKLDSLTRADSGSNK